MLWLPDVHFMQAYSTAQTSDNAPITTQAPLATITPTSN